MRTDRPSTWRPVTALFAVVAVAAILLALLVPTPAAAGPSAGGDPALIDASRTGELRITKALGDPFTEYGDPQRGGEAPPKEPAAGAVFEARRIDGVDLTTADGWREAERLSATDFISDAPESGRLGEAYEATTGEDGVAVFTDLPLGLYHVTEQPGSAAEKNWSVAEPFIVAVPSTDAQSRSGWNYSVSVNAKDQKLTARKAAGTHYGRPGQQLSYGITATVPAPYRDGTISRVSIHDPLDPASSHVTDSDKVILVDATKDWSEASTYLDAGDFTVTVEETGGQKVARMDLTDSGLARLAALRAGNPQVTVNWVFTVLIESVPADKVLRNRGYLIVDGYPPFSPDTRPGVPTNETRVRFEEEPTTPPEDTVTPESPTPTPEDPSLSPTRTVPTPPEPTPEEPTLSPTRIDPTPPEPTPEVPVPVPGPGIPVPQGQPTPPAQTPAQDDGTRSDLARTGADSWRVIVLGALLFLAGLLILIRRRTERNQQR
ncbi:SpaH/EbpB family LPXTG-anchored major pilin [Corynebacterium frankenforstense]|uniref:SpaH/EbpB family LPXTG-anchored major pilin n=3 Tax=Corynebacterium frankenforstense TaxID=1230998 RepID=UPI0012EC1DE9|nr:SpaH/EbpB family LPXTG-anchored major pilin [Corynebacterium frankenforstense]